MIIKGQHMQDSFYHMPMHEHNSKIIA